MQISKSRQLVSFSRARILLSAALLGLFCTAALAWGAGTDYTDDLPSVARVEAEIKGSDPTDTLARQVAVFTYLQSYIDRTKYARTVRGPYAPGELKMSTDYRNAAYKISQDYAKAHNPGQAKAFERLHGQYEMDERFNDAWKKSLIGPQAAGAYSDAVNSLAAGQRAHIAQEQKQYRDNVAAQQTGLGGASSDPTSIATRRCLELGGNAIACLGKGFSSGLLSLITGGSGLSDATDPKPSGVVLSGTFHTPGATTSVNFTPDGAGINHCGDLQPVATAYSIHKSAAGTQIMLQSEPHPIMLAMRPDGSLLGPGLVEVAGQVIIGYHNVIATQMINGVRAAPNQCSGPCQTITQVPDYAPKTVRCSIASFAPPSPPERGSATPDSEGLIGALTGVMSTITPVSEPGIRIQGKYISSSGLILDFGGDAVTIDCGMAHIKAPYTVADSPASFTVHVQNPGGPFALAVLANNTLSGSASTTVNGRLVSGMAGDNVTFTPHSESCKIATLAPQLDQSSSSVAAATSTPVVPPPDASVDNLPIAAAASATTLIITSTFPTVTNPLAGRRVMLMTAPFDQVMRGMGAPIPVGTTPGRALQAWAYACSPPRDCGARARQMTRYEVGAGTFDSGGKVILSASITPGAYYVLCSVVGTKGILVWDLPAALKAGENTVHLTATNAELIPIAAKQ